jgi:putative aminopeptidase FrvX
MSERPELRIVAWMLSGDTGISSEAIVSKMTGLPTRYGFMCEPADPSDLGRCLRLLRKFPEWGARIGEMAEVSQRWSALVAHWDEIAAMMEEEVGIDWEKGQ